MKSLDGGLFNHMEEELASGSGWSPCVDPTVDQLGNGPDDWFVNNITGGVVYAPGEKILSQKTADVIGAGDAGNYSDLGPNNMFGDKVPYGQSNNMLAQGARVIENPEQFMSRQGYKKGVREVIEETTEILMGGFGIGENIHQVTPYKNVLSKQLTYAKTKDFDKKTMLSSGQDDHIYTFSSSHTEVYSTVRSTTAQNTQSDFFGLSIELARVSVQFLVDTLLSK